MKKFLINIVIFFAVIAVCDYVIGSALLYMNLNAKVADNGRNNMINQEMTADIVIMGSSKALHHYVPQIIEDSLGMTCYNAGTDGQGIVLNYAHYLSFSKRYTPKVLIYDVLPEYDYKKENDNTRYLKWLKPYYYDNAIKPFFKEINPVEALKMGSHLYRVNNNAFESIHDYLYPNNMTDPNKGYTGVKGKMESTIVQESNNDFSNNSVIVDSLKFRYLENLILSCQRSGTQFIICISPRYGKSDYSEFQPAMDLADKYNIKIIDHLCDEQFNLCTEYFHDADHLNEEGSCAYTSLISKELSCIF